MNATPSVGEAGVAVVTGGSSGIGAAFARALSERGHPVVLLARDAEALVAVAADLVGPSRTVVADLATADGLARAEQCLSEAGPDLELLVNNAATGTHGRFTDQGPADLEATIRVNVLATARLCRSALQILVSARRGGIINVSSPVAGKAVPELATYAATKSFGDSLMRSVRAELAGTGISMTTVIPGWTRSGFHARLGQDVEHVPEHEWQDPSEVAHAALAAHDRGAVRVEIPSPGPRERLARLRRCLRDEVGGC